MHKKAKPQGIQFIQFIIYKRNEKLLLRAVQSAKNTFYLLIQQQKVLLNFMKMQFCKFNCSGIAACQLAWQSIE